MMQNYIDKLTLNAHQTNGLLQIFISNQDEYLGQLIILADVNHSAENNKKIIKLIIDETKDHYFNSVASDSEKALEDALQKVNFSLSEIIKQTGKNWLTTSNITIISLNQQDVHFSKIGDINAFLVSGKDMVPITESNVDEEVNPVKIFANIYSGVLPDSSNILFLTENILDYISQDKLRKLSLEQKSETTITSLELLLKKAPKDRNFGLVIIKRDKEIESVKNKNKVKLGVDSLKVSPQSKASDNPSVDEATTVPLDQESGNKKGDKKLKKLTTKTPKEKSDPEMNIVEKKASPDKTEQEEVEEEERPPLPEPKIVSKHKKKKKFQINRFLIKRLLIVISSVIIIGLGIWFSRSFFGKNNQETPTQPVVTPIDTQYQLSLNGIQSNFIDAQNLLISEQHEDARTILVQTIKLIENLPAATTEQKEQKVSLAKKVATQLLLAEGVDLTVPELVHEFSTFTPLQIVRKENHIYILSSQGSQVHQINLTENVSSQLETISQDIGNLETIIDHTGNTLIFFHSLDGLARLNLDDNIITDLEWNRTGTGAPIAADIYQNKLYIISADAKLLKYSNSITGFTQEIEWLKNPAKINLSGVTDIAIDGDVWLLKNTGEIIKLFKGERENFTAVIKPALQGPTRLYTDLDLKYLYILDPPTRRVVIIDKEGNLIKQVTSQEFTDITDMVVDEDAGKIYLLDETRILEMTF